MVALNPAAMPDPDFLQAPKRKVGAAVVPLPGYQHEALLWKERIQLWKWCRQAGKDFAAALKASLDALESNQPWFIISLTERQSMATFEKVKMHLRAWGVVLNDLNLIDETIRYQNRKGEWCEIQAKTVVLPGGGRITALPGADPDAIAGLTGNVIFTEFALFPNGGVDHWRVVFPLITRGFKLIAISTPRGHDTKFAELCRNPKGLYRVSVVDIHRALRDGTVFRDEDGKPCSAEALEALYNDAAGWSREYLVQESDELDALIAWKWIELAKADYAALRLNIASIDDYQPAHQNIFARIERRQGPLFLGWDVARTGDLSPVWVNQLVGDTFWARLLINMHKVDFDYMALVLNQGMQHCSRGAGDATGLGLESCERLSKRYEGRFDALNFRTSKPAIGSKLMTTFQGVRQRIPARDWDDVIHDLYAIQKETGAEGKLVLHESKNPLEKRSHCDMAYGCGLALMACPDVYMGPIEGEAGTPGGDRGRLRDI